MLGDVLRRLRENQNLTPKELAEFAGVTYSALLKYERNEREPDYATLIKFADYFNVSLDYLLDRKSIAALNQQSAEFGNEIIKLLVQKGYTESEDDIDADLMNWVKFILDKALDIAKLEK